VSELTSTVHTTPHAIHMHAHAHARQGPPFDFKLVSTQGVASESPPPPHPQPPAYMSEQEQGPSEAKRTEGNPLPPFSVVLLRYAVVKVS